MKNKGVFLIGILAFCGTSLFAGPAPVTEQQTANLKTAFGDRKRVLQDIQTLEKDIAWARFQLSILHKVSPATVLSLIRSVPQVPDTVLDVPILLEVSEPSTPEFVFQVLANRQENTRQILESSRANREAVKKNPGLFPAQVPVEEHLSHLDRWFNAVLLDSAKDGIVVVYIGKGNRLTPEETRNLILRKKVLLERDLIPYCQKHKEFLHNRVLPLLPE